MRDPARILVVDDVADNVEILRMRLSALGYDVDEANDGEQALAKVAADPPDLVLLDIMMPKIDGLEVVRRMKADKSLPFIPVILVTAKATPKDVVTGLDAGGDDYLTKPFEIDELLARVRAHLRRAGQQLGDGTQHLQLDDLELDPASREVRRGGAPLNLTAREFDLLHLLISQPGQVHERRRILHAIWGETWVGDDNVLDVYIRALRRKIEPSGAPTLIQTVRGVGFMLKVGAPKT